VFFPSWLVGWLIVFFLYLGENIGGGGDWFIPL
jgi:hypothetical protein